MKEAKFREIPVLFVRFEDLVMNPEPELQNIMKFMIGESDLTGTNAERRIQEVLAQGASATQTYNLKESTKKFNSNMQRLTPAQIEFVKEECKEMIHFFGYAKTP